MCRWIPTAARRSSFQFSHLRLPAGRGPADMINSLTSILGNVKNCSGTVGWKPKSFSCRTVLHYSIYPVLFVSHPSFLRFFFQSLSLCTSASLLLTPKMESSEQMANTKPQSFSLSEVRRHNSGSDCWIVVHSKVYDVSAFHPEHPGGSAIILKFVGANATAAYDEIHAPGILEQTLPPECCLGLLDLSDVEKPPEAREAGTVPINRNVENEASLELHRKSAYTKPELFKPISTHDFEDVARNTFTAKALAFYSSAATDLVTHHLNSEFYKRIMTRPRVMRNVKEVSIRRTIMGCNSSAPFFVSPTAMARLAHPDGELAIAQGCDAEGIILTVSQYPDFVSFPIKPQST